MPEFETDTEVGIMVYTTNVSSDDDDVFVSRISAISTEHEISRIIVWNRHGKGREYGQLTNEDDFFIMNGKRIQCKRAVKEVSLAKSSYPICIEAYESADNKEKSDGHRHGWFGADGHLREDKGHQIDPDKLNDYGFYPKFPGSFTKGLSGTGPVYEPKYR